MPLNWNLQWRNHNAQRSYPLTDWATKTDTSGTLTLPDDFLTGMELPIHAGLDVEPDRFYVQSVVVSPIGITISIGYSNGTTNPLVASASLVPSLHTEDRAYPLTGVGDFYDTVGSLIVGTTASLDTLPAGTFLFDFADGALDVDAVRPIIRNVSALIVVNGNDRSPPLVGDVELVAGTNVRLDVQDVSGTLPRITINAITGEGLIEECACDDEDQGPPIRFINGRAGQPNGNLPLAGSECLQVGSTTVGLRLTDVCSKPCCKCEALSAITDQLRRFSDGVSTLQGFANRVGANVEAMSLVVLGSKLGSSSCINC